MNRLLFLSLSFSLFDHSLTLRVSLNPVRTEMLLSSTRAVFEGQCQRHAVDSLVGRWQEGYDFGCHVQERTLEREGKGDSDIAELLHCFVQRALD